MKILFTLCGRAGSKGFENKNIQLFLGYPLSYYTLSIIELYKKNNPGFHIDVALNTDSPELKLQVSLYPLEVFSIQREESLAGDTVGKIDVIADTYNKMKEINDINYDFIIDLDITSPLRTLEDLEQVVSKSISSDANIIFTVTESRRNPSFNMVKKNKDTNTYGLVLHSNFTTRQEAYEVYDMNASIYSYKPEALNSKMPIFSNSCDMVIMKDTGILDIDSHEDFLLMEVIAKYLYQSDSKYSQIKEKLSDSDGR